MIYISVIVFFLILLILIAWKIGRSKRLKSEQNLDYKKVLLQTKIIKIDGIPFEIRKINVLDYLEGAKVLAECFGTYRKVDPNQGLQVLQTLDTSNLNQLKKYITDIICAGVVKPKFTREEKPINPDEIPIKDLFNDWVLAQKLSQEIFEFTHGKKK